MQKPVLSQQEVFKQSVESSIRYAFQKNNIAKHLKQYSWIRGEEKTSNLLGFKVTKNANGLLTINVSEYKTKEAYNTPIEMKKFIAQAINQVLKDLGETDRVPLKDIYLLHKNDVFVFGVSIPYNVFHK